MAEHQKNKPAAQPGGPTVLDNLRLALRDEAARRRFHVRLNVRGGLPAQSYRLEFDMAGSGEVQSQYADALSKREGRTDKAALDSRQVLAILKTLAPALELADEQPRFLPDTLVGILEISDGTNTHRIYFAADPDQAKAQGKLLPPALQAAVNSIYAAAAKLLGQRSVKP